MGNEPMDPYAAVLADLEAQRAELDAAIAVIRRRMGQAGEPIQPATPSSAARNGTSQEITSDAFFGMSMAAAVRKYLQMMRRPQAVQTIADALKSGGFTTRAENFYSNVYTTLKRGDEFVKVKRGEWGLAEWYGPRAKAIRAEEGSDDASS